jgi:hypothetical protein
MISLRTLSAAADMIRSASSIITTLGPAICSRVERSWSSLGSPLLIRTTCG